MVIACVRLGRAILAQARPWQPVTAVSAAELSSQQAPAIRLQLLPAIGD
jgi:hypothetical protein